MTSILKRAYNYTNGATASHNQNGTSKVWWWGNDNAMEFTQSYRNFDKIVFFFSNGGDWCEMSIWDSWALELALQQSWRLNINPASHGGGAFWIHGNMRTEANLKPTTTHLIYQGRGTNISQVWGINY